MRDDFQVPNLGQAPDQYTVSFFNRFARSIEQTLTTLRAKGTISATTINAEEIKTTGTTSSFFTSLVINASAGTSRYLGYMTDNVTRWLVAADNTAEGGANAGSDFAIYRYADDGTFLGMPFYIQRSTGDIYLSRDVISARDVAVGRGVKFPATQVASTDPNTLDDYEEGTWTPTITASTGTITTSSATGTYTKIGRVVFVEINIVITTNGTGAGTLRATLPFNAASANDILAGRNVTTGLMLSGISAAASSTINIVKYDNTYPAASGNTLVLSGTYGV